MKLFIEYPDEPFGEDFDYITEAQRLQKALEPFTQEILSEAPYAVIAKRDDNLPYLKNAILSGDLQEKIRRALSKLP